MSEVHATKEISMEYQVDKVIFEKFDMLRYTGYESIIWGDLGTHSTQIDCTNYLGYNSGILDQIQNDGSIEIYFSFADYLTTYDRYPDTIFNGLSKIGGLFAALKISVILLYANSNRFEKKLKKRLDNVSQKESKDEEKSDIEKEGAFLPFT